MQASDAIGELLVIEDHALLRAALALALRNEGFVVHAVDAVPAALDLLAERPAIMAAVLEIDFGPTKLNGFIFAKVARVLRPEIGIVFLTGRIDLLVGRMTGRREAHLVKPTLVPRIADAIRKVSGEGRPTSASSSETDEP